MASIVIDGTFQIDESHEFRNCRNFIGFFFRGDLCHRQSEFRQLGTHHVHGAESLRAIVTSLHGLAVDRHVSLFLSVDASLLSLAASRSDSSK